MYRDLLQLEEELDKLMYDFGYQLVDLQTASGRNGRRFRVFIERVDGSPVTLDDCAAASPQIRLFLEGLGVYGQGSTLEVGSPGLDRVLKRNRDFERYLGSEVKVTYFDGGQKRTVNGELISFTDDVLLLEPGPGQGLEGSLSIPRAQMEQVRLVPQFKL
jgi:ribosome maturation factor RimP